MDSWINRGDCQRPPAGRWGAVDSDVPEGGSPSAIHGQPARVRNLECMGANELRAPEGVRFSNEIFGGAPVVPARRNGTNSEEWRQPARRPAMPGERCLPNVHGAREEKL